MVMIPPSVTGGCKNSLEGYVTGCMTAICGKETNRKGQAAVLAGVIIGLASLFFVGLTAAAMTGADVSRFGALGNFLGDHSTGMIVGAACGVVVSATVIAFGRTMKTRDMCCDDPAYYGHSNQSPVREYE